MADGSVIIPIDLVVEQIQTGEIKATDLEKSIEAKMKGIAKSAGEALGNIDVSKLNKTLTSAMGGVIRAYDQLASAQSGYSKAVNSAGSNTKGFKEAQAEVGRLTKNLKVAKDMYDMFMSGDGGKRANRAIAALDAGVNYKQLAYNDRLALEQYEQMRSDIIQAKQALDVAMTKTNPADYINEASPEAIDKVTTAYGKLYGAVDKVTKATQDWNNAQNTAPYTNQYQTLVNQYDKLMQKIEGYKAKAEQMQTTGASTAKWQKLAADIATARKEMEGLLSAMREMANDGGALSIGDSVTELPNIEARAQAASDAVGEIPLEVGNTTEAMQALNSVTSKFKSAILGACKTAIGWIKKVGSAIAFIGSNSKKSDFSLKKLWRNFMMFGLGFRSMYFLIKKLRTAAIDALKQMATQIPAVNKQISSIQTSMNTLRGSIATAFQPILPYIAAAFEKIAAAANVAATAVAKFFATLSGQGVFYKFTAATQDYAKSASAAGGAANKLKRDLMGFDEINKLSDNSDSGGGAGDSIGSWESTDFEPSDFVAKLKESWEKADFTEIGQIIAVKLTSAFNYAADWINTSYGPFAQRLASSVATLINGVTTFIDADNSGSNDLSESIGRMIGSAINNTIGSLNTFVSTTNWSQVGTFIADSLTQTFERIDWAGIASTFALSLSSVFTLAWSFVSGIDFESVGKTIGNAIDTFFTQMNTVNDETGMTGWETLGATIGETVTGLGDFLIEALSQVDWQQVGQSMGTFISSIDWGEIGIDMTTLAWEIISGIGEAFVGLSDASPMTAGLLAVIGTALIGADIVGAITKILTLIQLFQNLGLSLQPILTILQPIAGAFLVLIGIIMSVVSFVDMLKNGFSWLSETIMLVGIALGVVGAILLGVAAWPAVIVGAIVAVVATLVIIVKEHWDEIIAWCTEAWENIKNAFNTALEWIKNLWDTVWTAISTFFTNIWNGIVTWVTTAVENVKTAIRTALDWIKSKWTDMWTAIKTFFTNIWNGMKTFIKSAIDGIKTGISNGLDKIKEAWSNTWDSISTKVTDVWTNIKDKVKEGINGVIKFINKMISGVAKGINTVIGAVNSVEFDIPDWVPVVGGDHFGLSIPTVSAPQIPLLAKGAVLPANNPFLAMVGDQKSGTNIEAPLSTIEEAVAVVMNDYLDGMMAGFQAVVEAINNKDVAVNIGDNAIGRAAARYNRKQNLVRG